MISPARSRRNICVLGLFLRSSCPHFLEFDVFEARMDPPRSSVAISFDRVRTVRRQWTGVYHDSLEPFACLEDASELSKTTKEDFEDFVEALFPSPPPLLPVPESRPRSTPFRDVPFSSIQSLHPGGQETERFEWALRRFRPRLASRPPGFGVF